MRQPAPIDPPPAWLPEYMPVAPPRRRRMAELIAPPPLPPRYRRNERGERMLTVARLFDGRSKQPMIRMRGAWLRRLGFTTGARIFVTEEPGRIVLTLEGEE